MSGIDHGVWVSVWGAARILGVATTALDRAVANGQLVTARVGGAHYVRRADLVGFAPPPKRRAGRPMKKPRVATTVRGWDSLAVSR